MITLAELRQKAERKYLDVLRAIVRNETPFPMRMRVDKRLSDNLKTRQNELNNILKYSRERRDFGYDLQYRRVNTRRHSEQDEIDSIQFSTEQDYLRFLGKEAEADQFRNDVAVIAANFPELRDWCERQPLKVLNNHAIWPDLLQVCRYFQQHPTPGCYIRELPVAVHTKFIEENQPLLHELLDCVVPVSLNCLPENNFFQRFGLREKEEGIRIRFVGEPLRTAVGSIQELTVPITTFSQLNLTERDIFIIENEINFLTFPTRAETIVIWGKGFAVKSLKKVSWLASKRLLCWHDLDIQGFEMLSQLRGYFPNTEVIAWLMDWDTLHRYESFWVSGTPRNVILTNLRPDEEIVFQFLHQRNLRLEQERIIQVDVLAALSCLDSHS